MTGTGKRTDSISVVVPHLNQPGFLVRLLESLAAQTWPAGQIEIIVVDNGSTPETLEEVTQLVAAHGARLGMEKDPGPGPARNHGLSLAQHDFLAFIDADCVAAADWLEKAMACLQGVPDCVYGGDVRILGHDASDLTAIQAFESVFAFQQQSSINKHNFCLTGNLVAHRKTLEKVGPFADMSVAEDRDWGRRATAQGIKINYVPDMIVYHPARDEMEQLRVKWRRHIQHDYNDMAVKGGLALRWLFRAFLVLGSIPVHSVKVMRSGRISGLGNRLRAITCLVDIRLYRIGYMLRILSGHENLSGKPSWNREEAAEKQERSG